MVRRDLHVRGSSGRAISAGFNILSAFRPGRGGRGAKDLDEVVLFAPNALTQFSHRTESFHSVEIDDLPVLPHVDSFVLKVEAVQ